MPFILKKYYPWRNILFVAGEGLLVFFIINSVFILAIGLAQYSQTVPLYFLRAVVVVFVFQMCLYYLDLYDLSIIPRFSEHMLQVLQAFGFGCIILAVIYYFFPFLTISTGVFWSGLVAVGGCVFLWRFSYFIMLERRMFTVPVALFGTGRVAREVVSAVEGKQDSGFKIAAFVGDDNPGLNPGNAPVFKELSGLWDMCANRKIEKIILALDDMRGTPMHDLIDYKFMGIDVHDVVRFYEELTGKLMVERVNPSLLLFSDGFYVGFFRRLVKRFIDISVASVMLLLSLPVFLFTAVMIKFESPGPVFYRQERVGKNGKVFEIIKFRSMRDDAEKDGPVWASTEDDRITKFGRFIRKVRIDELPQLINVIRGEMSFVGPRPERPVFVRELQKSIPFYTIRHVVKPGITGWAQICYPYGASQEDALRKLEYDLYYIKNLSLGLDLSTIFQTIKVVLFQKGSR